jgi:hypothetical protein
MSGCWGLHMSPDSDLSGGAFSSRIVLGRIAGDATSGGVSNISRGFLWSYTATICFQRSSVSWNEG